MLASYVKLTSDVTDIAAELTTAHQSRAPQLLRLLMYAGLVDHNNLVVATGATSLSGWDRVKSPEPARSAGLSSPIPLAHAPGSLICSTCCPTTCAGVCIFATVV